jgi:hypothetical protein
MPLYYFSLSNDVWLTQEGELLADDAAARLLATQVDADRTAIAVKAKTSADFGYSMRRNTR